MLFDMTVRSGAGRLSRRIGKPSARIERVERVDVGRAGREAVVRHREAADRLARAGGASGWPVGALVEDSGGAAVAERLAHGGGFREVAGWRRGAARVAVVERTAQVLRRRAHAAHGAFAGRHDHVGAAGGHGVADERGNIRSKVPSRSR